MGLVRVSVQLAVVEARYTCLQRPVHPRSPEGREARFTRTEIAIHEDLAAGPMKANGSWEHAIDVSPLVRRRLSATQLDCLAALSKLGHLATDGGTLTFRCFDLEVGSPGPRQSRWRRIGIGQSFRGSVP